MAQRLSMSELLNLKRRMGGGSKAPAHSSDDVTAKDTVEVVHGASLKEKVEKLAFQNAMCLPPSLSQSSIANRPRRIAVCLVIVDCLIHEDLWRRWMEGGDEDISAELYIHAKHPDAITSPWVKERTLPGTFLPEWNSIEVVRAMLAVLEAAAADKTPCDRFLFATETCVPLYSLQEAGRLLFATGEVSWLDAYNEPQHAFETAVFRSVDDAVIPQMLIWKALPGWVLLTRRHALDILALHRRLGGDTSHSFAPPLAADRAKTPYVDLPAAFSEVYAPEEVFFPTVLAMCGHLTVRRIVAHLDRPADGTGPQVLKRRVTFAKWKSSSDPNPISHESLTPELLHEMRASGAVFGRKFKKGTLPVDHWARIVASGPLRNAQVLGNSESSGGMITSTAQDTMSAEACGPKKRKRDEDEIGGTKVLDAASS